MERGGLELGPPLCSNRSFKRPNEVNGLSPVVLYGGSTPTAFTRVSIPLKHPAPTARPPTESPDKDSLCVLLYYRGRTPVFPTTRVEPREAPARGPRHSGIGLRRAGVAAISWELRRGQPWPSTESTTRLVNFESNVPFVSRTFMDSYVPLLCTRVVRQSDGRTSSPSMYRGRCSNESG